jgi:hypothetical protein
MNNYYFLEILQIVEADGYTKAAQNGKKEVFRNIYITSTIFTTDKNKIQKRQRKTEK